MHWKEDRHSIPGDDDSPVEGCCHSAVKYDGPDGEELVIFGGGVVGVYRSSLHKYNLRKRKWRRVRAGNEGEVPGMMSHTAVVYKNGLYVYGGLSGGGCLGVTYRISLEESQNPTWERLRTTGDAPRPTKAHSTVLIGHHMWIFYGAMDSSESTDAVHTLDLETLTWEKVTFKTPQPAARNGQSTTLINGYIYLFGGLMSLPPGSEWVSASYLESWVADVWRLNPTTLEWTLLHGGEGEGAPKGRYSHLAVEHSDNLLIFGGDSANCTLYYDDTWVFDIASRSWKQVHPPGDSPPPLSGISGVPHSSGITFFGGETPDSTYSSSIYTLHTAGLPTPLSLIMQGYFVRSHLHLTLAQFEEFCDTHKVPRNLTEAMVLCKPRHRCKRQVTTEESARKAGLKTRRISI